MTNDRLHVDWIRCDGRGLCHELLPEILEADDWGYPVSRTGDTEPEIPRGLRGHADRAIADCPRLALSIRRAPSRPATS